jgi:hypothetical protein
MNVQRIKFSKMLRITLSQLFKGDIYLVVETPTFLKEYDRLNAGEGSVYRFSLRKAERSPVHC